MNVSKKVLNEISVAGLLGALIGLVVALALITEFGSRWFVAPAFSIIGAVASGICYRPAEVWQVIVSAVGKWRKRFATAPKRLGQVGSFFTTERSLEGTADFFRKHHVVTIQSLLTVAIVATFAVSSRYTVGVLMGLYKPIGSVIDVWVTSAYISFVLCFVSIMLFGGICDVARERWASWKMPISGRVFAQLSKWWEPGRGGRGRWTITDSLYLWLCIALLPPCSVLFVVVGLLMVAVDIAATIALALASTERLSAILGGLIGSIGGYFCLMHEGWPRIVAVIVCGVLGLFSGRWLYILRMALTFKVTRFAV